MQRTVQGIGSRPLVLHELASFLVEKAMNDLKLNVAMSLIHQTDKFEDQHARNAGLGKS